ALSLVVMNDLVVFTTNGATVQQACLSASPPCTSPWLTVWAINQANSSKQFKRQPFANMFPPPPTPGPPPVSYPLSFAPSAPTVDPRRNRIFVFDAGPGKLAALDLEPDGWQVTWMVDQRTTAFMALIGPRNRRVLVTTEIPGSQPLNDVTSNYVVWREPDSGREGARSDELEAILSGTMVEPGYAGRMYYLGNSGEIKKLTVRPAR